MKISAHWLRDFVDLPVNYHQLADEITLAGVAVEGISGEGESTVFEMEITTNRPDAMNHYGVARECSALYDLPLKPIEPALPKNPREDVRPSNFIISIEDKEGCARYTARVIQGVTIKSSPDAIVKRLASVDQRAINNAADASNYTLWEMGHPTHAFDLDLLEGGKIVVRRARAGETLKTLDGVDRKLDPQDLIIADAKKPVALAGVMGGFDTMITDKTKNVLIESAWFDPTIVRKTAKRHGLHTDASHRFERGADYGATSLACARVAQRILESGGGKLIGEEIDAVGRNLDQAPVELRVAEVHRILGKPIETNEIFRILKRLGFELAPEPAEQQTFTVNIPSWRLDVEREIDLIEEIARLHGYDKFANTLPAYTGGVVDLPNAKKDDKLRASVLALGYDEAVSLSFISHEDAENFSSLPVIELANPLSAEASVMRTSLVPGMLSMLAYNLNRGSDNVRLFEVGNVFELASGKSVEHRHACLGATGSALVPGVHQAARPISFFDLKGDVETLLRSFDSKSLSFDAKTAEHFHPGKSARALLNGTEMAQFGQIHPEIAAARKFRQDILIAELDLAKLYQFALRQGRYEALPRFPAVERDFSFVFEDAVIFEKIRQVVAALDISELRSFVPAEIFRGGNVPAGKYSILLRAKFQSAERTLREDEVAQWSSQVIRTLEGLGGALRAS